MLEKEIKILEIDRNAVEEKLLTLGAEKTFEGYIHDIYYDYETDEDSKNKLEGNKRMFRIRKKGEEHIYTIKRKRKKYKKTEGVMAKDEHETRITNVESFEKVLEKYGLSKIREKKKHRVSYKLENMEFDFDLYENIPEFLEIEGPDGKRIESWVKKLELSEHEIMIGGSRKIFKRYDVPYNYF